MKKSVLATKGLAKTTPMEKVIYGIGGVGANLCWTFMTLYITMYYTNSVGISAAFVGSFMLASRILDGISDIIFAAVIRKVHTKLGAIRHWFLICAPMLGISLVLCFNVPGSLSETGRGVYAFATYAFTAAVSYTIFNLAFASFLPLISSDDSDRTKTASLGNIIIMAGVMAMSIVTPILLAASGGEGNQGAWTKVSMIYALLCTLFVAALAFIKEKNTAAQSSEVGETVSTNLEKIGFKTALRNVFGDKYAWLLMGIFILFCIYSGLSGISYYYIVYIFGGVETILSNYSMSVYTGLSFLSTGCIILGMVITPIFFKKFGKQKTVMAGILLTAVSSALTYIAPGNFLLYNILKSIASMGTAPLMIAQFVFVADLSTYFLMKRHIHVEETVAMTSSIGVKVGTGLGAAIVGWGLELIHFDGLVQTQSAGTLSGIIFLSNGFPVILCGLIAVMLIFWDLDKKMARLGNAS